MALLDKPNMEEVWASGGAAVKPSDEKIQTGWTAEVPPYQYENWIQGRQDQYLAHINQRGIPQWDGVTEYEGGGLSYTQGTDGVVYKSVDPSGPSGTVQDPTTDVGATYWEKAFADNGDSRIVNAVPNDRTIIAGTGLSGGGSLAANRTLSVDFATPEQAQALTADDVAITPDTLGSAMNVHVLGMGQAWQDVTSTRSFDTVYTNTSGRVIFICITSGENTAGHSNIQLLIDGLVIARPIYTAGQATTLRAIVSAVIPPGSTYQCVGASGTPLLLWSELR